jgi:hypothetical protein
MLDTVSNINGRSSQIQPKPKIVNGRGLHRRRLNRAQRANLGVDVLVGAVPFKPSLEQAALIFNVPRYELSKRVKLRRKFAAKYPEDPRFCGSAVGNGRSNGHAETLAEHIRRSSPTERLDAARIIGPSELWDSMVLPVISDERATENNS